MATTVWGVVKDAVIVPDLALPEGAHVQILLPDALPAASAENSPIGANGNQEDNAEARKALIRALPGKYRLISSDDYAKAKRREAALEDQ